MDTRVRVGILKGNKCIYESVSDVIIDVNEEDKKVQLTATLKETQRRVNQFLTTLILDDDDDDDDDGQQNNHRVTKDELDDLVQESGSDDDDAEERNSVNPKKSKISD